MILLGLLSIIILASINPGFAGPAEEAWEAYLTGNFDLVKKISAASVADSTLSQVELARVFLALGSSEAMQGHDSSSIIAFESALKSDPTINLTPSDLPPPVWRLYAPVRQKIKNLEESLQVSSIPDTVGIEPPINKPVIPVSGLTIDTVYVFRPLNHTRSASIRSLIFPGLGHLKEGRKRGLLFAGLEVVLVTGWVVSAIAAKDAREDYLGARNPDDIDRHYDRYNSFYQLSWGFTATALATYIASQVDFFTNSPPEPYIYSKGKK